MAEVTSGISRESIYDSELTYEQRAQLRRQRREEKARMNGILQNGSVTGRARTTSPISQGRIPASQFEIPQPSKKLENPNTKYKVNSRTTVESTRTHLSRLNSEGSMQSVTKPSKSPPVLRANSVDNFLDKRPSSPRSPRSPLAVRLASSHLKGIIDRHQERERSCSPVTPSPLSTPITVIPSQKQAFFSFPDADSDEKSFYTSSGDSTLTPSLSALRGDKTASTITEQRLPETGSTPSDVVTLKPREHFHNGTSSPEPIPSKITAVQSSTDSGRSKSIQAQNSTPVSAVHPSGRNSTSDQVLSAFDSWDNTGSADTSSTTMASRSDASTDKGGGTESVALPISNGRKDKASSMHEPLPTRQWQHPPSRERSGRGGEAISLATSLKPPPEAMPAAATAAIGLDELDGGRVSRQSNTSESGSWEFESFQWNTKEPENEVHPLAANSKTEASFDPLVVAETPVSLPSNALKYPFTPTGLVEQRGMEVASLEEADFVNVITIGGMSQGDPLSPEPGQGDLLMQGVDCEELLGSSVEGICGSVGILGHNGGEGSPKLREEGKNLSAAKSKKSESTSPPGSGKKSKGKELSGSGGKKSKESKKSKEKESGRGRTSSSEKTPEKKSESKIKGQAKKTSSGITTEMKPHGSVSIGASDTIRSNPNLPSASKQPIALRKGSSSFRDDGIGWFNNGLSKASLPNLCSPTSGSSREGTPDCHHSSSATSEDDSQRGSKKKKEKLPLRKRLSMSMKSLLDRDGGKTTTSKTAWTFAEGPVIERRRGLFSAQSELQLSVLTEKDRESLLADTELIPRTYSMECLHPADRDRFLDSPGIKKPTTFDRVSSDSDSEYLTASDSELNDYVHSSVSILSSPSDATRDAGYGGLQSVSSPHLPQQSPQLQLQTSRARAKEVPAGQLQTSRARAKEVPAGDNETTPKNSPEAAKKKRAMTTAGVSQAPTSQRSCAETTSDPLESLSSTSTPSLSSSSSNGPSSFSRFSKGRVPIRKPSVSKSPHAAEPTKSSLSERVERIKQQRRTESLSISKPITVRKSPTSSPVPSQRVMSTSKLPSISRSPKSGSPVASRRTISVPKSPVISRTHSNSSPVPPRGSFAVSKLPVASRTPPNSSSPLPLRRTISASKSPSRTPPKTTPTGSRKLATTRSPVPKTKAAKGMEIQTKKEKEMAPKTNRTAPMTKAADTDSLLTSVGQQLDKLKVSPASETPESDVTKSDVQNRIRILPLESDLGPSPVTSQAEKPTSPPSIASMPAFVFSAASPLHSRQSSYDVDPNPPTQESFSPPEIFLTPNTSPQPPRRGNEESRLQKPAATPLPVSDIKRQRKSPILGILRRKTAPGPPIGSGGKQAAAGSREKASVNQLPSAKTPSPTPQRRGVSTGKRPISTSVARPLGPSVKSDSNLPVQRTSSSSRTSAFTSALPPKPPSMKKIVSESALPSSSTTTTTQTPAVGRPKPAGGATATTNLTRPSSRTALRSSQRKLTPSTVSSSSSSSSGVKSKVSTPSLLDPKGSLSRSSIRGSGRKKTSSVVSPKHFPKAGPSRPIPLSKTYSPDEKALGSKSAVSLLRSSPERNSSRRSTKSVASFTRPSSACAAALRKVSSNVHSTSLSQDVGGKSSTGSLARHSMRRVSSGEMISRKVRPGASGSLNRRERRQSGGSSTLNRPLSGSKSGGALRPQSASTVRGTAATKSMRLSRTDSRRKIIGTGTLPRTSTLTRIATPPSSVAGSIQSSPGRLSMRRSQSGKDVFAVFDQISAEAQGSILPSSDHRRLVRPKFRQKASTSHLKMLQNRKDVSSELSSTGCTDSSNESGKIDPNTYSTYMSKKSLAPSAIAGLASKLDLSTVKLRKTGIVEQILSEQAGGVVDNRSASPNPAMGMDYNTSHSVMVIQIKGRRLVQSRLVEPSVAALNSGDVFIAVSGKQLFHWIGKSANVIEKARGSDVVMRILHKRELGCHATQAITLKEGDREAIETRRDAAFWELLGGKKGVKSSESVPSDEVHEKAFTMATRVYQLEGEGEKPYYSLIHDNMPQMVRVALLNSKKILLFDFFSEVYVWIGKQTPTSQRKKALELGKEYFNTGCRLPVFTHQTASPARSSGRYRPRTSRSSLPRSPRQSVLNSSGRRSKKSMDLSQRPSWALFARVNEGSEPILFREKFADWPEPGRIIKMKGHRETTPPTQPAELQPADVSKMLKPLPAFEGLRLEGDNIYRGQGNFKVSRSTFACNRVRTHTTTKWVIKEFDNVLVPDQDHGLFHSMEAYVIRWAYIITVVRDLEGLTPGLGPFARDRKYQKSLLNSNNGEVGNGGGMKSGRQKQNGNESDSDAEVDSDDECRKILESGGRDRCAYYFWQGDTCTVNEKGASALMTVELDKEKGPQVRVVEGKEPPAFLSLFGGGMIILLGRSETHSLKSPDRDLRLFCVRVHVKNEACLVEVNIPQKKPIASQLRSRGCYVLYHRTSGLLYLWQGLKVSHALKKSAVSAAKMLRNRLQHVELVTVQEGAEPNDLCTLLGDRNSYHSLTNDSRLHDYTPRLFELTSTTGEFTASEVIYPARTGEAEPFHFLQRDLYSAIQPAIFLLDAHYEVYVWLGWWPEQKNQLLREANATTGSAHSRWLRDKRLALETAQLYVKGCNRPRTPRAYMVTAGTEHERFINQFPFWEVNETVQELNCKTRQRTPWRVEVDEELKKYSRTRFTLEELKKRPLPEGVDPAKLETFLSDDDFKKVFRMAREQFQQFSSWKQANLKKQVGLF